MARFGFISLLLVGLLVLAACDSGGSGGDDDAEAAAEAALTSLYNGDFTTLLDQVCTAQRPQVEAMQAVPEIAGVAEITRADLSDVRFSSSDDDIEGNLAIITLSGTITFEALDQSVELDAANVFPEGVVVMREDEVWKLCDDAAVPVTGG